MRNCQEINQTKSSNLTWECFHIWNSSQKAKNSVKMTEPKSSNLIWECFDIWNSGWKVKNRVEMTEPKSSNLSVNEKLSRKLPNQVQQLEFEWEIVKKLTKPSPATWFESVFIYGIQVKKPKIMLKWRNPSPATWLWMKNSQEMYPTKSSSLIWKCFDMWNSCQQAKNKVKMTKSKSSNLIVNEKFSKNLPAKSSKLVWNCFVIWNSGRKAKNRVEMTEPKSSNLNVNEKLSRNLPNQLQQLDLKLFWYMEFRSKSQKQSWNDGTQVQQL